MQVLLIQKEGIDLYSTLLASETSRDVLRFYQPKKTDWGVCIEASTLGSALSVISELKWYIQRYIAQPLCLLSNDLICTPGYAGVIYGRENPFMTAGSGRYSLASNIIRSWAGLPSLLIPH